MSSNIVYQHQSQQAKTGVNTLNPASSSQTKLSAYQQQSLNQPSSQLQSNTLSKLASSQISPSQSTNGTALFQNNSNQNLNTHQPSTNNTFQKPSSAQTIQRRANGQNQNGNKYTEEKVIGPMQKTQQPQKTLVQYEATTITGQMERNLKPTNSIQSKNLNDQTNTRHKPTASMIQIGSGQPLPSGQARQSEPRQENGEKMLNKRHQMRMTSGDQKKHTPHNITRSLIDEGSEDFTNIEEHIQEDTRISCRNAVASSLNNVSQSNLIILQLFIVIKQGMKTQNVRNRRGTTQSNMTGPSNQPSKEETFETSSFFDEGVSNNNRMMLQKSGQGMISPHRCNQVEGYNIPTIFNTLMFGIDQNKVSSNVRESFSKVKASSRPISQLSQQTNNQANSNQYQKQLSNKFAQHQIEQNKQQHSNPSQMKKNASKEKLSQLVTKVEKSPIMVFDQSQQKSQKHQNTKQASRNAEIYQNSSTDQSKNHPNNSGGGRQSQLSIVAQQNLKIEQQIDPPESLTTEIVNRQHEEYGHEDAEENDEIIQKTVNQIEDFQTSELHRNHLIQTLQSLQYIKTLPPVNKNDIKQRAVRLPPPRNSNIKKTIIFDLDETLVHCIDDIENNPCDQVINVTFPNGETVQAGINIRPYALECLRKANESYQVVVFTASHKAYADVVLDHLDPERSLIQYRLYRDHCIRTEEGIYIKDLRIITNRQLKDLIIVDNAVYSFGYQLDNGIPIIPFYDDKSDEELMHLIFYINCLANCVDVREQNRKAFQLKDLQEIDIAEYLQSMMGQNNHVVEEEDEEDN